MKEVKKFVNNEAKILKEQIETHLNISIAIE